MIDNGLKPVCEEDRDNVSSDSIGVVISCLGRECNVKVFVILKEYKIKKVTCPWCGQEHKARCYKNGSIDVSIGKIKDGETNANRGIIK